MAVGHLDLIRIIEWEGEAGRGGETDRQTDRQTKRKRKRDVFRPLSR